MKDQDDAILGSRLRTARKMAGLSLGDLSARMGGIVSRQAIFKYEHGLIKPSPEVFERLAAALGMPSAPDSYAAVSSASSDSLPISDFGRRRQFRLQRSALAPEGNLTHPRVFASQIVSFNRLAEGPSSISDAQTRPWANKVSIQYPSLPGLSDTDTALERIRFRGRQKLSAKTTAALKLRIEDYVRRCLEVESALGLEQAIANPLAGRAVESPADVEAAALDVRRAWDLGSAPVPNLLGLLEEKGIRVYELRGIERFEGLSGLYGGGVPEGAVPFIAVNRDYPADRLRFTAAHELGHLLCGFEERESAESLCHVFASALLLPRTALERALMPGRRKVAFRELKELKESYGLSLQAIVYRARTLGLLTDRQVRSFRETMRANGWLVKEPVEYLGNEHASRLRRLLGYAVAESIIPPERAAALAGVTAAEFLGELGNVF